MIWELVSGYDEKNMGFHLTPKKVLPVKPYGMLTGVFNFSVSQVYQLCFFLFEKIKIGLDI